MEIKRFVTEQRNEASKNIDKVSTIEMVKIFNEEDKKVALAVEKELQNISKAIDIISEKVTKGGRLIYMGAGTSGRLGILDASECPPTFGVDSNMVQGLIAGGYEAVFKSKEGAEDDKTLGVKDLKDIEFSLKDVLVGIAASGRTPYVIGGLEYANELGAETISLTCNPKSQMASVAKLSISPVPGPEVVTGSTRMKAGTAQKMVLNMLSTGIMIKLGKVYGNLMVDVQTNNEKLVQRAKNIIVEATDVTEEEASKYLEISDRNVKLAILLIKTGVSKEEGINLLDKNNGYLSKAIGKE